MNVLLIVGEDHGPQLGCYGDPYARTPHLDTLAASGTRFERAYATQAICSPGRASLLTGMYPHQNGQISLATHGFCMFREYPTIPSLLQRARFRTGRIGKLHVKPESASPFDLAWNPGVSWGFAHRDVAAAAAVAGDFMAADSTPFFLMVNLPDAHLPWLRTSFGLPQQPLTGADVQVPPAVGVDSLRLREHAADYYNCLSRLDTGVGLILDALTRLGKDRDTLVIYTTDHGPQFARGKGSSYELAVHLPLLVRWPGVTTPGSVSDALVSQIDILPTILDANALPCPAGVTGSSLRPVVAGMDPSWRSHLCTEWHTGHASPLPNLLNPQRTIRGARFKLIQNLLTDRPNSVEHCYTQQTFFDTGCTQQELDAARPEVRAAYQRWRRQDRWELYDLQDDPHEFTNLAADARYTDVLQDLQARLRAWQQDTADPFLDDALVQRFVREQDHIAALPGTPAKQADFRWPYLDYLQPENARDDASV